MVKVMSIEEEKRMVEERMMREEIMMNDDDDYGWGICGENKMRYEGRVIEVIDDDILREWIKVSEYVEEREYDCCVDFKWGRVYMVKFDLYGSRWNIVEIRRWSK